MALSGLRAVLLAAVLIAAPARAGWTVDPAASRIGFTAGWMGKPLAGRFARWTAMIDFDPAAPQKAVIVVDIDLASATTGDRTADGALPEKDWLGSATQPKARFTANGASRTAGANGWLAHGILTMRGHSVPVDLPFTLVTKGDVATVQASARLDRRSWDIGTAADAKAEFVAFSVPVTISLNARRTH